MRSFCSHTGDLFLVTGSSRRTVYVNRLNSQQHLQAKWRTWTTLLKISKDLRAAGPRWWNDVSLLHAFATEQHVRFKGAIFILAAASSLSSFPPSTITGGFVLGVLNPGPDLLPDIMEPICTVFPRLGSGRLTLIYSVCAESVMMRGQRLNI